MRDRQVWLTSFALFWFAQVIVLFRTGGIASPIFGGHTLLFLLVLAGVFVRRPLKNIFVVGALHIFFWAFLTYFFQLKSPPFLTSEQVVVNNLLIFAGTVCTVLTIARTTERFVDECDRQRKSLNEAHNHLCHAERMAGIGKLVATTAHELAQPIQIIVTVASMMRRASKEPAMLAEVQNLSERVNEATDRLQTVLGQLRNFSRKEPFALRTFDLSEAIRSVKTLSQYDLRWNGVKCEFDLCEGSLWTRGDSMRIQQVVFNLINNARDACGGVTDPVVRVTAREHKDWVRISVWNNGLGIPTKLQAKLFQPYFTTKDPNKGTGLGLTICKQLIEQHGGRILFSSQDGDTCFVIDLPRAHETRATSRPSVQVGAVAAAAAISPIG
jgi:signal transduction histidine kinase